MSFLKRILVKFKKRKKFKKKLMILFIVIFIVLILGYFFKFAKNYPLKQNLEFDSRFFGVSFSRKYCEEIGLDWKEVYLAILDDLEAKEIRLPIYWDDIEPNMSAFDFSQYDYMIEEGSKRGVNFIINIGWRLPRWPECHAPNWASKLSLDETREQLLIMIDEVVSHYKDQENIIAWQLENEPFFDEFGVCPPSDHDFFKKELDLLRSLDSRPVLISATGELSLWRKEAQLADIFGSTVYRVVWNKVMGYIRYPIPAWFYRLKADIFNIPKDSRVIIELQAEPWVPHGSIIYLDKKEIDKSFNLEQFKANAQFAINIKFQQAYLWGVEWWYHQLKNGEPAYWDFARNLFK